MHLGNARTALFNALLAKNLDGIFLLRIEDTDKQRSDPKLTLALQEDLRWLGLHWQEGVCAGGNHGPYLQSERQAIYEEFYGLLQQQNLVYPCFCSEEQLKITRKIQLSMGKPPRYAGTCCRLSNAEITHKLAQGLKPTLRFRVPENERIAFYDLIKGEQCINSSDIGDFIVRRTDGSAPFMFCNAIDDALMGVTHALRGEDHLTNTPRQLMILRALKLPEPNYGHMPLIIGGDGAPLSKRHGSRNVQELRELGFLNTAVINYLARLGQPYATDDLLRLDELAIHFSCATLSNSPAKFDEQQLHHWQKKAVTHLTHDAFCTWLDNATQTLVPLHKLEQFANAIQPNVTLPHEAREWAEIFFATGNNEEENTRQKESESKKDDEGQKSKTNNLSVMTDEALQVIATTPRDFYLLAVNLLSNTELGINSGKTLCDAIKNTLNLKGKELFMPLRAALTGRLDGPHLTEIFSLLGKIKVVARLSKAAAIN